MVPRFILEKFAKKNFRGQIKAGTMFVDISGFTNLTQILMENGKEGVEILTDAMNYIFSPAIKAIMENKGFVSSFAGDAFTAIFPIEDNKVKNFLSAAIQVRNIFLEKREFKTELMNFKIKVKIGLSYGTVNWNIIQSKEKYTYFFDGDAIIDCSLAEENAKSSEIILSKRLFELIKEDITAKNLNNNFYKLEKINFSVPIFQIERINNNKYLSAFVPEEILNLKEIGEFRKVISCFISLEKNNEFYKNIVQIMDLVTLYKGYFNKIDFGDKGYVILVIFGAPTIPDNVFKRAAEFAIKVRNLKNFNKKIGMTFGVTYSGFIGSDIRKEYTSIGMTVNLAARLMMIAKENQILIDKNLKNNLYENYEIEFENYFKLKGFDKEIVGYKLIKRSRQKKQKSLEFINREQEKAFLRRFLERTKKKSSVLFLQGREGVGKTTLIQFVLSKQKNYRIFTCDSIIQKSFSPILNDIKDYFNVSEEKDENENLIEFNLKFDKIKFGFLEHNEIERVRTWLKYFLNIKNTVKVDILSNKLIHLNVLFSLTQFYSALIDNNDFIFVVDDSDFIDVDTKEFFENFINIHEKDKLGLIFIYNEKKPELKVYSKYYDLKILPFDKKTAHALILKILTNRNYNLKFIPKKTFNLIYEKTEGVPLFIQQMVEYLIKNNLIDKNGNLLKEDFEIPSDISLLVISKIDKFEPRFKKVTKVASVLGKRFSDTLLSNVVKEQNLEKFIVNGEKEDIWFSLTKLDHIFRSSLIRDSVYELILKKELQALHKKVARTIIKLYKSNKEVFYPDIAYNYLKAKEFSLAANFYKKAAEYAIKRFELSDAIAFLKELYKLDKKIETLFKLINILILKGETKEVENYLKKAEKIVKKNEEKEELVLLQTKFTVLKQDYKKLINFVENKVSNIKNNKIADNLYIYLLDAYRALHEDEKFLKLMTELKKKLKRKGKIYAKLLNNIGIYFLDRADYQNALIHFEEYLKISQKNNDKVSIMKALHNIGIVYSRLGKRKKAKEFYTKALEISIKIGDDSTTVKLLSDIATIYSINNEVKKALKLYEKACKINKTIGNRFQQGILFYNMGEGYFRLQDYENAIKYVNLSIEICKSINDISGITFANDLLGDILFMQKKFDEAKKIYNKNLRLQKKINDIEGIAHTYGNLGNLAKVDKDYAKAEFYYKRQIKILKKVGDIEGEGKAWFNWAMVEVERKDFESAKEKLNIAKNLFKECSFTYGFNLAKEQLEKIEKGGE